MLRVIISQSTIFAGAIGLVVIWSLGFDYKHLFAFEFRLTKIVMLMTYFLGVGITQFMMVSVDETDFYKALIMYSFLPEVFICLYGTLVV